jgi:hypothetical protein
MYMTAWNTVKTRPGEGWNFCGNFFGIINNILIGMVIPGQVLGGFNFHELKDGPLNSIPLQDFVWGHGEGRADGIHFKA